MAGFDIEADVAANRLNMELRGSLDETQAEAAVDAVDTESRKLSPGFEVVNDISGFKPLSQDVAAAIGEGKQILAENGAGALVRITGESVVGTMQFKRVGDREGYHVAEAESHAEAEDLLAGLDAGSA
ncbi:hypothetical protein [Halomarina rubra]|uniref:Uncharacterized protein n=1 Tax=Halomarina rubra TaxID=2071873 RepID=A0ABD6AV86_9EURY|nr:hypothetical protein [Halomarina rubra]